MNDIKKIGKIFSTFLKLEKITAKNAEILESILEHFQNLCRKQ
jgi:hypothetical protein